MFQNIVIGLKIVKKRNVTYDFYKRGLKYQENVVKPNYTASLESFIGDLFIHRHH